MSDTFFFYDLETTGISPRTSRIMQFAGQRTSLDLKEVGKPVNSLVKITPDILPDPSAILLTKITPQQTLADGLSETDFLKLFYEHVVRPSTIFVGYNNVRFDDEFIRFLNYRNFYDAYEWQWKNNCSRWDILDVVRMTRALRPDSIKWPVNSEGKPTNRLSYLTEINKLKHDAAHDALSDVHATINVANLIKKHQPDLFNYLLSLRKKQKVAEIVESGEPFVYTSSHYSSDVLHTTAVCTITPHKNPDTALVYDLRQDPRLFFDMSVDELVNIWRYNEDPESLKLPIKTLKYNRVPAIAPLGVIKDKKTLNRINLDLDVVKQNLAVLRTRKKEFAEKLLKAVAKLDDEQAKRQESLIDDINNVDERLYENFVGGKDKAKMRQLLNTEPDEINNQLVKFDDSRLNSLLPLYKARNYPGSLSGEENEAWLNYCRIKFIKSKQGNIAQYFNRISELEESLKSDEDKYILEELKLYGESIMQNIES
jgi:exodeoxyribonuclease-1